MLITRSLPVAIVVAITATVMLPANAQGNGPSAAEINQWLDNSSSWGQAPSAPSGMPAGQTGMAPAPQLRSWPAQQQGVPNDTSGWQRPAARPRIQGMPVSRGAGMQTPFGRLTPRDVLRIMFGGNPGDSGSTARNQEAYSNASGNLQTALDQASQADDAASRASYGSDQGARQSAAGAAQNHANAARGAADAATSSAAGASSEAQDQAAQARDAADRAQYAADRAAANAGGGGW